MSDDERKCATCGQDATYVVAWPKGDMGACDSHLVEVVDAVLIQGYRAEVSGA